MGELRETPLERRPPAGIHENGTRGFRVLLWSTCISWCAAGCGIFGSSSEQHFTIKVDSIVAPASITPQGPLTVRFFGLIGPNSCYGLEEVRSGRSPSMLTVEFRGRSVHGVCPQEPVPLDYELSLPPPFSDPFVISVVQPSGPALEKSVRVQ